MHYTYIIKSKAVLIAWYIIYAPARRKYVAIFPELIDVQIIFHTIILGHQ